jgi:hypothetical protein
MPKIPEPTDPAEPARRPAGTRASTPAPTGPGARTPAPEPALPAPSMTSTKETGTGGGCGEPVILDFPCFDDLEGIQGDNLRTSGDAYYEGMFERIGAFRAIDELIRRFLGGLNLGFEGMLRSRLTDYMRQEPLRIPAADRQRVLSLFGDATLERLLVRLADTVIAFDLSRRPGGIALTPSTLPEAAAQLDVITAIEDLELFLDGAGGGGVSFVTDEVGKQLMEILRILNDPELRCHIPGNDVDDVFSVIAGLLPHEKDRPTDWEARQMARQACSGRKIFCTLAEHVDGPRGATATATDAALADAFAPADLEAIIALVYEWRAAHGSMYGGAVPGSMYGGGMHGGAMHGGGATYGGDAGASEQAADESRLQVIRLRRRAIAS